LENQQKLQNDLMILTEKSRERKKFTKKYRKFIEKACGIEYYVNGKEY